MAQSHRYARGRIKGVSNAIPDSRRMPTQKTRTVILSCGHSAIMAQPVPKIGHTILCGRCREPANVRRLIDEWAIRCRDCNYSRLYGESELTARTKASSHALRKHHIVDVMQGRSIRSTSGKQDRQTVILGLDDLIDPPPF